MKDGKEIKQSLKTDEKNMRTRNELTKNDTTHSEKMRYENADDIYK